MVREGLAKVGDSCGFHLFARSNHFISDHIRNRLARHVFVLCYSVEIIFQMKSVPLKSKHDQLYKITFTIIMIIQVMKIV